MKRLALVVALLAVLAGCEIPRAQEYGGQGYSGVSIDQAWQECRHEVARDLNNAGAFSMDAALMVASTADARMDSCMAAKGFYR